jgi:2-iminobutanoate/2-iminopropanoate deaminase
MKRKIEAPTAAPPGGAYSPAVADAGLLFISGQVGRDPVTDQLAPTLTEQVELAIRNLEAVAAAAGITLSSVVKTTCFLADIGEFDVFNRAYEASFPEPFPARSTVGVSLANGLLFEIEAVAVLQNGATPR